MLTPLPAPPAPGPGQDAELWSFGPLASCQEGGLSTWRFPPFLVLFQWEQTRACSLARECLLFRVFPTYFRLRALWAPECPAGPVSCLFSLSICMVRHLPTFLKDCLPPFLDAGLEELMHTQRATEKVGKQMPFWGGH